MSTTRTRSLLVAAVIVIAGLTVAVVPGLSKGSGGVVEGTVTIKVRGKDKRDRSGVVIYIEGVKGKPPRVAAAITQRDKAFTPGLTVVTKGSTVEFPNQDKIFHNVFSVSRAGRFDLGLYKSGTSKSVKLRREGVIDVYCNIHPQMVAKIKVVDTGYYAVTGKDGRFRIEGVPAGTYPIIAWQAHGTQHKGSVTVKAGGRATVDLALVEGKPERSHTRKDGTPYGRYQ
jgi:plastocyanin